MQTAEMGGLEKHSPEFGVHPNGAGKTTQVVGERAREVCGVDDHGTQRKNSTFVSSVVR